MAQHTPGTQPFPEATRPSDPDPWCAVCVKVSRLCREASSEAYLRTQKMTDEKLTTPSQFYTSYIPRAYPLSRHARRIQTKRIRPRARLRVLEEPTTFSRQSEEGSVSRHMVGPGEGRLPRAQGPEGVLAQSWPTFPRRQGPKAPGRAQGGPAQPSWWKLSMGLEEI